MDPLQSPGQPMAPQTTSTTGPALISFSDLLKGALHRYKSYFSKMFPAIVVAFIALALSTIGKAVGESLVSGLLQLIGIVATLFASLVLVRIISDTETDPRDIAGSFMAVAPLFFPYVWFSILKALVMGGSFGLLFFPGIIVLVFLCVSSFVFIVEGRRGLDIFVGSWNYVTGRWWEVFGRLIVLILTVIVVTIAGGIILSIIGFVLGGHGSLGQGLLMDLLSSAVIVPFSFAYVYLLYMSLKTTQSVSSPSKARTWIMGFAIFGIVVIVSVIIIGFTVARYMPRHNVVMNSNPYASVNFQY